MKQLRFGGRADAYLEWAFQTCCRGYCTDWQRQENKYVGLLVQWRDDIPDLPPRYDGDSVRIPSTYRGFEYAAMAVESQWLLAHPHAEVFLANAARIELASPIAAAHDVPALSLKQGYAGVDAPEGLLLGCIDAEFPLANAAFFRDGKNRIARFWNQDADAAIAGKRLGTLGDDPDATDFCYGKELLKSDHPAVAVATSADLQDESAYYERMGMSALRRSATHGAHVLDIFAGPRPARSRLPDSRDRYGGGDGSSCRPPSRQVADDPASRAPIVVVQLPDYAIEDPSGRWLGRNILDGLHYIDQVAGPVGSDGNGIRHVVVSVSWGPQTGPRDGTSLLELAMDELVARRPGRQLDIVLAAGNSRNARAHAEFEAMAGCDGLVWCVPPALESPSHLEIWWPGAVISGDAKITVTSPDGTEVATGGEGIWTAPGEPHPCWGVTQVRCGHRMMALVALAPTFVRDSDGADPAAAHGRWLISVKGSSAVGRVHVNVARTNHNMGARKHARSSYLRDAQYEEFRHSRQGRNGSPPPLSLVQSSSTLNGIATGAQIRVASGYRLSDASAASYASQGPCAPRDGPDLSYPTDESALLPGIMGGAVRAGTVARLVGTSTAAPQLARELAEFGGPIAEPRPESLGPRDPRLGMGRR